MISKLQNSVHQTFTGLLYISGYLLLNVITLCPHKTGADDCFNLIATADTQYILSHTAYGRDDYSIRENSCWEISAENGSYVVQLDEKDFSLEYGGSTCIYDYVAIYDGPTVSSKQQGVYCGSSGPGTIYSTQQYLTIKFMTDSTFNDKGFRFTYSKIHRDDVPEPSIKVSTGTIIGIVFCSVVVIIVVGAFVILCIKNKYRKVHPSRANNNRTAQRPNIMTSQQPGMIMYNNGSYGYPFVVAGTPNLQPVQPPSYQESLPATTQQEQQDNSVGNNAPSPPTDQPPPAYSNNTTENAPVDPYTDNYPASPPPAYSAV